MTTITINRALLEQIVERFETCDCEICTRTSIDDIRAALAAPAAAPEQAFVCSLGCTDECVARAHGVPSECPSLPRQPATAPATTSIEDHTLERLLDAWDTTVLPKHRDGAMQEWMEALRHEFTTCPDRSITGRVTDMNSGLDPDTETDDRHAQELLAQGITLQNMAERHAQELCAYSVTVDKLRAERNPMTDKEIAGAIVRSPDPMAFGKLPAEGWRPMVRLVEAFHGITGDKP